MSNTNSRIQPSTDDLHEKERKNQLEKGNAVKKDRQIVPTPTVFIL